MKKTRILLLALVTLVLFPLIGLVFVFFFVDKDYGIVLRGEYHILIQVAIGLVVGVLSGLLAWFISNTKWVEPRVSHFLSLIGSLKLRHIDVIFISICAGVGEELLFRGAIQPVLGIWITAIIFVLIHGYINPKDWRMSIYGLSMTLVIAILGYMTEHIGIWSAAAAHAMIDYVLLRKMIRKWNETNRRIFVNYESDAENEMSFEEE